VDLMERHPAGSQAFMPLSHFPFIVVVAPAGEDVDIQSIAAFVTNGRQGVNYHRGVWHMPMKAMQAGEEFLVIDRAGEDQNCDELYLSDAILIENRS
jgi:ureidoglycolate lyase